MCPLSFKFDFSTLIRNSDPKVHSHLNAENNDLLCNYSYWGHVISAGSRSLSLTGGDISGASWKERIQHTQSRDHSSGKFVFSFILISFFA